MEINFIDLNTELCVSFLNNALFSDNWITVHVYMIVKSRSICLALIWHPESPKPLLFKKFQFIYVTCCLRSMTHYCL